MGWIITFLGLALIIQISKKLRRNKRSRRTVNRTNNTTRTRQPQNNRTNNNTNSVPQLKSITRDKPKINSNIVMDYERAKEKKIQDSKQNSNRTEEIKITGNLNFERNRVTFNTSLDNEPKNKSNLIWVGEGGLKIGYYLINNAMTYYNNSTHRIETSACIPNKLKIGTEVDEEKGALGYWPSYAGITPDQRANYLKWMQSGRRSELKDVGYIFIFFYGLEYRLLIEKKDKDIILKEVKRLLELYSYMSGSLKGYLGNFVVVNNIKNGVSNLSLDTIKSFEPYCYAENFNAIKLAWFHLKNKPLPAEEVISVIKKHKDSNNKNVVVKRIPEILEKLFILKYNQKYPEGMFLKVAKKDFDLSYRPASSELHSDSFKIPNVLGIDSQFNYCIQIWNESIEELKKASTVFSKGNSINSSAVYSVLPELLRSTIQHPLTLKMNARLAHAESIDSYKILEVSDITELFNFQRVDKLTLTQSKEVSALCKDLGQCLEPDSMITGKAYKLSDKIALFKINGEENLSNYKIYSLILEIGIVVANADGNIENDEVNHVINFLEGTFMLSENEKIRINALKNILIKQPPSVNGLGKKLKSSLDENKIKMIAELIVGISAIDGNIDKDEIKTMKTLFKAMDLEMNFLDELIDKFQPTRNEPVEIIAKSENSKSGEMIPAPKMESNTIQRVESNTIQLDHDKIKSILSNTKEISSILKDIFEEEEPEEIQPNEVIIETVPAIAKFDGLDNRYHNLLTEILERTEWELKHFEELTRRHNQMPAGALDAINEWSDDVLGDFLIMDEGKSLIINKDLIEEM